jgi:hypothetical protein
MGTISIDDFKNKLITEFQVTETYSKEVDLNRSFNPGVILLAPHAKDRQSQWISKAFFEWNRTGRTVVIITPYKPLCRYFMRFIINNAQIRLITDTLIYDDNDIVRKPMIVAIFKEKPVAVKTGYITFD